MKKIIILISLLFPVFLYSQTPLNTEFTRALTPRWGDTIIYGAETYEGSANGGSVLENTFFKDRDTVRLFYTGSISNEVHNVCMAVATSMEGPWTKRGIMIGNGVGGAAASRNANSSVVFKIDSTYWCFALDGYGFAGDSREVYLYKSIGNAYSWQSVDTIFQIADIPGILGYGNTGVWPEKVNNKYHALVEAWTGSVWETFHGEADELDGDWTFSVALTDMQVNGIGMYGGNQIIYHKDKWHIFYHYGSQPGNLPTYVAYARTIDSDFDSITIVRAPYMPIIHRPWGNTTNQIADPWINEIDGVLWHAFEVVENSSPTKNLLMRQRYNGTFYNFIKELE